MKSKKQRILAAAAIAVFVLFALGVMINQRFEKIVIAQETSDQIKTPVPKQMPEFDQEAALAKLREQIKGKEKEPAEKVFKNSRSYAVEKIFDTNKE